MKSNFRDSLSTINDDGKRIWLYPKAVNGRMKHRRRSVMFMLLLFFIAIPSLTFNKYPILLLHISKQRFYLFGKIFWPHDFYALALVLILIIIIVFLLTVAFGRIFCGWFCPQTIFLEHLFRPIERFIEGSPAQQKKLQASPLNGYKIRKKMIKYVLFFLLSFFLAVGILRFFETTSGIVNAFYFPSEHPVILGFIFSITVIILVMQARLREQVCTLICPYGRIQDVLLDDKSVIVSYDFIRGEPRKGQVESKEKQGDCVNCSACVQVCPTGIDIRNGTQLECINCTACIDACNHIMQRFDKPKGLIRYVSRKSILSQITYSFINARTVAYLSIVLCLLVAVVFVLNRNTYLSSSIVRVKGSLTYTLPSGNYRNIYQYRILNKENYDYFVSFKLKGKGGVVKNIGTRPMAKAGHLSTGIVFIELSPRDVNASKIKQSYIPLDIGVYNQKGTELQELKTNFLLP